MTQHIEDILVVVGLFSWLPIGVLTGFAENWWYNDYSEEGARTLLGCMLLGWIAFTISVIAFIFRGISFALRQLR